MISSEASGQNEQPQDEGRQGRKTILMPETDQSPHRLLISLCLVERVAAGLYECPVDKCQSCEI